MCNGIAVLVWEKEGVIKGLCTGISSHDELAKLDDDIRYGKIEPYRFELLYPCNLTFDRAHNFQGSQGIANEQPEKKIWEVAFDLAKPYFISHNLKQLQYAYLVQANLREANLEGADLEGANLRGANLGGANLEGANLEGANLRWANLEGANLEGANLEGANLRGANLEGANLRGANLRWANLVDANLRGANLRVANLRGANLVDANLRGAKYDIYTFGLTEKQKTEMISKRR